ncbi:MAG: ribonuclease H-like domain-containing protein [Ardenticatenia bacterium]|nr:ribonuclease H-like domain-containing protein [Ardenticatenia bacterium]
MTTSDVVVFDLETQRAFSEVGGRNGLAKMGISVGVLYRYKDGRYYDYGEHQVDDLVAALRRSRLVVGFNVLHFDYHVLQPYTDFPLHTLPTLDILDHVHRALGFRVKLDTLARHTLGVPKGGNGLLALHWWRTGQLDRLREYCRQDVEITRRLYEFGRNHGYLLYWDRRLKRPARVDVSWT